MNGDKQKKISVKKVILCVVIAMVVAVAGLVMYSEKVHKIGFIENIKQTIEEMINPNATGMSNATTIDVTNIVNDDWFEHEHEWNWKFDDTNHWQECEICKERKDESTHTVTENWSLTGAKCRNGNSCTKRCECGYVKIETVPHTWNGGYVTDGSITGYKDRKSVV